VDPLNQCRLKIGAMAAYGKVQLQQATEDSVGDTAKAGDATR